MAQVTETEPCMGTLMLNWTFTRYVGEAKAVTSQRAAVTLSSPLLLFHCGAGDLEASRKATDGDLKNPGLDNPAYATVEQG